MKNFYVKLALLLTAVAIVLSYSNRFTAQEQNRVSGQMVPAKAEFLSDGSGGALRSDGLGTYIDGKAQCVTANVSSAGRFYLRTVTRSCRAQLPRAIEADLSSVHEDEFDCIFSSCQSVDDDFGQVGTLNNCGANLFSDVTIRAQSLFADPVPADHLTGVQIEFNLSPDFKNTAFYLNGAAYIQPGSTPNERYLTTGADQYKFALVKLMKNGQRVCLGMYNVPFTIKVIKGL